MAPKDLKESPEYRLWSLSDSYVEQRQDAQQALPRQFFDDMPHQTRLVHWVVFINLMIVASWLLFVEMRPAGVPTWAVIVMATAWVGAMWLMLAAWGLRRTHTWEKALLKKIPLDGKLGSVASPVVYGLVLFCVVLHIALSGQLPIADDAMLIQKLLFLALADLYLIGLGVAISANIWRIRPLVISSKWGKRYGWGASINLVLQQVLLMVAVFLAGTAVHMTIPTAAASTIFGSLGLAPFAVLFVGTWVNFGIVRPLGRANKMSIEISQALGTCISSILRARLDGVGATHAALVLDDLISVIDSSGAGESLGERSQPVSICHLTILAGARDELAVAGLPRGGVIAPSPTFDFRTEWLTRRYGEGTWSPAEMHHDLVDDLLRYLRQLKQHADRVRPR